MLEDIYRLWRMPAAAWKIREIVQRDGKERNQSNFLLEKTSMPVCLGIFSLFTEIIKPYTMRCLKQIYRYSYCIFWTDSPAWVWSPSRRWQQIHSRGLSATKSGKTTDCRFWKWKPGSWNRFQDQLKRIYTVRQGSSHRHAWKNALPTSQEHAWLDYL